MKKLLSLILVVCMLCSFVTTVSANEIDFTKSFKVNFLLSEETGANSKLFVPYKANSNDYKTIWDPAKDVAYVDYISDSAAPKTPNNIHTIPSYTNAYSLVYTENPDIAKENPYIIYLQDGKYWEINGIKYEINVNDKAVKLRQVEGRAQYDFTNVTDTSLQDRYKSLLQVEIDVVEGNYEKVGLLTTMSGGNGKDPTIYVKYKGESAYKQVTVTANTFSYSPSAPSGISEEGYIKFKSLVNSYDSTGYLYSVDEIPVDSTKILEKIKIVPTTPYGFFSLISLWGTHVAPDTVLDAIVTDAVTEDNVASVKTSLEAVDTILAKMGCTSDDLTGKYKTDYETAKQNVKSFEAEKIINTVEYVDLSIANGANSKLFVNASNGNKANNWGVAYDNPATTDYNYMVDYLDRIENTSAAWTDTYTWHHTVMPYSKSATVTDGQYKATVTLDLDSRWTVNYGDKKLSYFIDTDNKAIRIRNYADAVLANLSAEKKAVAKSINKVTIDFENGKYDSVNLLAGTFGGNASLEYTVHYTDGDVKNSVSIAGYGSSDSKYFSDGYLTLSKNLTTTDNESIVYRTCQIDCDDSRVLDKITFSISTTWREVSIISALGEKTTIREYLDSLPESITLENIETTEKILTEVDEINKKYSCSVEDYPAEYADKYNTAKKEITKLRLFNNTEYTFFQLDGKGANSKLFIPYNNEYTGDTNYTPGLDYYGHYDNNGSLGYFGAIYYTKDKGIANAKQGNTDLTTGADGNLYWKIGGVDYLIRPEEKVIKLASKNANWSQDIQNIMAPLDSVTLDVEDGKYDKLGFLAAASYNRRLNVTVNYSDGSFLKTSTSVLPCDRTDPNGRYYYNFNASKDIPNGGVRYKDFTGTEVTYGIYVPYEIAVDSDKTVESVVLSTSNSELPISIISVYGKNCSLNEVLNDIPQEVNAQNCVYSYSLITKADKLTAENGLSTADYTPEILAKYNNAKARLARVFVTELNHSENNVKFKGYNFTEEDKNIVIIAVGYNKNETVATNVKVIPTMIPAGSEGKELTEAYELTTDKVKIYVWEGLKTLVPVCAPFDSAAK